MDKKFIAGILVLTVSLFIIIGCPSPTNDPGTGGQTPTGPAISGQFDNAAQDGKVMFYADYSDSNSNKNSIASRAAVSEQRNLSGKLDDGDMSFNLHGYIETGTGNFSLSAGSSMIMFQITGRLTNSIMENAIASIYVFQNDDWQAPVVHIISASAKPEITSPEAENQLPQTVDRTALGASINAARETITSVVSAINGSGVWYNRFWATSANIATLNSAITTAETTYTNVSADQTSIDDARTALETASAAFADQKQTGTKSMYLVGTENGKPFYWKNGVKTLLPTSASFVSISDAVVSGGDIYIAGSEMGGSSTACYWKNGTRTALAGSAQAPTGIAVSGSDIYVSGMYSLGNDVYAACYWKNGTRTVLSSSKSVAHDITVSGGDVYIAGSVFDADSSAACYWKNGSKTDLPSSTTLSEARAIAVNGSTVYTAGKDDTNACYWTNTSQTNLETTVNTTIDNIFYLNSSVYVYGGVINIVQQGEDRFSVVSPCYWQNGTKTTLNGMDDPGFAHGILLTVSGANTYVAGDSGGKASYWKNGTRTALSSQNSHAAAIAVDGTDVYVAGSTGAYACYWKNVEKVSIPNVGQNSAINAIFIIAGQ